MASTAFTIFAGPPWRVAAAQPSGDVQFHDIELPSTTTPDQTAEAVAVALGSLGHRAGNEVLLALPSDWCLSAGIEISDLPKKDRRHAMLYRLEEKLPLAAEEFTADFV